MTRNSNPSSFFNFDGSDCGLIFSNLKFPTSSYTFSTWLRFEKTSTSDIYRIFSFCDIKGNSLELLFKGSRLMLQIIMSDKVYRCTFNQFFQTNKWYCIQIAHYKRMFLLSSLLNLYVDGELKEKAELNYPYFYSDCNFCHIGSNIPFNSKFQIRGFCGQLSSICFFDKTLNDEDVKNIYQCGIDFQYTFKKGDAYPIYFNWPGMDSLFSSTFLLFNPRSCKNCL
jgi:hypothetical protein